MASRLRRQLNDRQVKNAKPDVKSYRLVDGDGLYLEVTPSGSKIWRMRANLNKKEIVLTFGNYPAILLAQARKECEESHTLISQGIDPRKVRKEKQEQSAAVSANTFERIAREWHENKLIGWKENTARDMIVRLERDVFPSIAKS